MHSLYILIRDIWLSIKDVWHSSYRWFAVLVLLWTFRVTAMPADSAGLARGLQVGTVLLLLCIVRKYYRNALLFGWKEGNTAIKWIFAYFILGVLSTTWSYLPQFSLFLAFEKIVLLSVVFVFFYLFEDFESLERAMLLSLTGLLLFEAICCRVDSGMPLFIHSLPNGSCAAILLSYCIGEWMAGKKQDADRNQLLKSIAIVSLIVLITSTSGGANASAAFGVCIAFLLSGKIFWALLLLFFAFFLYLNQNWIDNIIYFIMPGKNKTSITTATGRTNIWEQIRFFTAQRPWLGWGYAAIERLISDRKFPLTDAHNNWYGAYGGTGIIGLVLLIIHQFFQLLAGLRRKLLVGYTGLICALSAATLNGYSYGYLSGKACSITFFYFVLIVAVVRFEQLIESDE